MTGIIAVFAFGIYAVLGKALPHVKGKWPQFGIGTARVAFLFMAMCSVMATSIVFFGVTIGEVTTWITGPVSGWIGWVFGASGSYLITVLMLILFLFAVIDLFLGQKTDAIAKTAAIVIPIAALVSTGPFGEFMRGITYGAPEMAGVMVSQVVGHG